MSAPSAPIQQRRVCMPTKAGDGGKVVCQSGDQPGCVRGDTCQRLSERASAALYGRYSVGYIFKATAKRKQ